MINVNEKNCSAFIMHKKPTSRLFTEAVAHPGLRICFVLRGSAIWQIDDQRYPVQSGNIIFLSDNQKRRFVHYGSEGFSLQTIILDRQAFTNNYHFSFFLTCIKETNGIFADEALSPILTEAYAEIQEKKLNNYELASAKLTEFFIRAERHLALGVKIERKSNKKMIKILDYIDARVTEKVTLSEVAQFAGFTESSFSRWFTKLNGISFKKYVMSKKIEHAIFLLESTDLKVIDVAYECGFESISGFYDTFKKITGTTPNKFSFYHDV